MYLESAHRATSSGSAPSRRAPYLDDVDYLRSTPDEMVAVTRGDGQALRFTFRNGATIVVDARSLRWHLKHDLKGIRGDPIPALAAIVARRLFRFLGGKKRRGVSLEEWVACNNHLCRPRSIYGDLAPKDADRLRRLRKCTKNLPSEIYSEQHGLGIVARPPYGRRYHSLHMHSGWFMVWYADGVECHGMLPGEGITRFFTWADLADYVRDYEEERRESPYAVERRKLPLWRLVYKMWD